MDSILNKIKSSVAEVLSGNPLSGHFEIQNQVTGSAGPELMWKIYGAHKKSTKEEASVFVFDKKAIDKLSKSDKNEVISTFKRGVQQLTRLRHPKVLSVLHPIEENRECLAFATEPVSVSLANVLGDTKNMDDSKPSRSLDEVEIKYGLLQILEAISFLHSDANSVHGNLNPNSIVLNKKRIWKLSGFEFYISSSSSASGGVQFNYSGWHSGRLECIQPLLDYVAPECLLKSEADTKSDIYSLGVLIHSIYNQGKPVYQSHNSLATCKRHVSEMQNFRPSLSRNIPEALRDGFKSTLSADYSERPTAKSLSKLGYFDDVSVLTLTYLDSLMQRDNLQKSQYFKNLPNVLRLLPQVVCLHRVLPVLFSECSNQDMIPFVLQNILVIADRASKQEYSSMIFPQLAPLLRVKQPIQTPLMFLRNMPMLLEKTGEHDTRTHILPMILSSIDVNSIQLQELCLNVLPSFSHLIDKDAMKRGVVPRIKKLCLETQIPNMRVKCLLCIGKMMTHMDKWFVLDEVLPLLPQIPRDAAILMTILGIYKTAFTHEELGIPREQLATRALPFLITLSVDHSLSKQQFQSYMSVIRDMVNTLEKEQLAKHNELSSEDLHDSQTLKLEDRPTKDDPMMAGFLKDSGLFVASRSSTPSPTTNDSTTSKAKASVSTSSQPTQMKDLTCTLSKMTIPTIQPPTSNLPMVSANAQPISTNTQPRGASSTPPVMAVKPITTPPSRPFTSINHAVTDWSASNNSSVNWTGTTANNTVSDNNMGWTLPASSVQNPNTGWSQTTTSLSHYSQPSNSSSANGMGWSITPPMSNNSGWTLGSTTSSMCSGMGSQWPAQSRGTMGSMQPNQIGGLSSLSQSDQSTGTKRLTQNDLDDLLG